MELWQLDATDLAHLIRTGRASAREATQSVLARMDQVNTKLNAIVRRFDAEALTVADAADAARARGEALGPLHGVPVTTKINTDQKGHPTDQGVVGMKDFIATEDAPVVANLRKAGAIIVGRSNAPAFSMRAFSDNALHGKTLNPRDKGVSPGGSSGGAGAATAAGMGPIHHGNDIGGSVRIPAYCNGVVGLRVGHGRIPAFSPMATAGRAIGGQLMSTQGPHTRTVRDARLALEVMAKGDPRDTRWADAPLIGPPPKRPIRVALVPEMPGGYTHPAQAEAVRTAGKHLEAAGYIVEEVLPPDIEQIPDMWNILGSNDVFRQLGPNMEKYGDEGGITSMRHWLELCPPSNDPTIVLDTLAARDYLLYRWQCFFQDTPLVIMPTLGHLPPPQDQDLTLEGQRLMLDSIRVSFVAPFLGLPGLAVPVGSHGNLRTGVQILAGRFREDLTLDAGEVIEAAEGIVTAIDPMW
ncbi:MAG: amidase [Alphaproteobacteria bacterium]|nr:amidase [Alphaproteobacteria bacterium]